MAIRSGWEDQYAIIQTQGGITSDIDIGGASLIASGALQGVDVDKFGLEVTNSPSIDPGQNIIDTPKSLGIPYRRTGAGYEFQQGTKAPSVTVEFDVTAPLMSLMLWLLLQNGGSQTGSAPIVYTFVSYTTPIVEVWCNFWRIMSASVANSHQILGGIVQSLTLSGSEGDTFKGSAEIIGADFSNIENLGGNTTNIAYDQQAPILYQDLTFDLNSTAVHVSEFSVTISNNAIPHYYVGSQTPRRFLLDRLEISGSFKLAWDSDVDGGVDEDENQALDDFIAGTPAKLEIYKSDSPADTDGEVSLALGVRYSEAPVNTEEETATDISFIGAYDGTTAPITATVACTTPDRGIA